MGEMMATEAITPETLPSAHLAWRLLHGLQGHEAFSH